MSIPEHPHCCCDIRIGFFSSSRSSSGGLKKPRAGPRAKSLWGKSGRKPGGQIGHKGETLRRTAEPDRFAVHVPRNCGRCGSPVTEVVEAYTARQVFDLPKPRPLEVTGRMAAAASSVGRRPRPSFPKE